MGERLNLNPEADLRAILFGPEGEDPRILIDLGWAIPPSLLMEAAEIAIQIEPRDLRLFVIAVLWSRLPLAERYQLEAQLDRIHAGDSVSLHMMNQQNLIGLPFPTSEGGGRARELLGQLPE